MIIADYHTHTRFSHGKGRIVDNARHAEEIGLTQLGISDHGLRHIAFGMRQPDIFRMRNMIDKLQPDFKVKLLLGVEANIFSTDGLIDLVGISRSYFDYVIAGYHKAVWPKNFKEAFKFSIPAVFGSYDNVSASRMKMYTDMYIKCIMSQKINIISHLNYGIPVDVIEVGKAARDYGVYIELNGKQINMSDEQILKLQDMGVEFIVSSDAHTPDRVGEFSKPMAVVERLKLDTTKIANWDRLPNFQKLK